MEKEAQPLGRASAALMRSGAMHTCDQACARSEDNGVVLGAVMKQAFFEVPELLGARSADRCGRSQSEAIGSKKSCCLNFTSAVAKVLGIDPTNRRRVGCPEFWALLHTKRWPPLA